MRSWLSCRCYAAGQWDAAQRNLTQALTLAPQLLEKPKVLLQVFYYHALSAHVKNPVEFMLGLFDHLPASADDLRPYGAEYLSRLYTTLALRSYDHGNIAEAKDKLTKSIELDPTILEQPGNFAKSLGDYALYKSDRAPHVYVDFVFKNLPAGAQQLAHIRSRVLGDVRISCAFQEYSAGHRWSTLIQILTALRYRPQWLRNRGVISILGKSLMGVRPGRMNVG
jgi:tetratricopeptide (TPR) repeat protein